MFLCSCGVTSTIIWSGHICTREQVTREQSMDTGPKKYSFSDFGILQAPLRKLVTDSKRTCRPINIWHHECMTIHRIIKSDVWLIIWLYILYLSFIPKDLDSNKQMQAYRGFWMLGENYIIFCCIRPNLLENKGLNVAR